MAAGKRQFSIRKLMLLTAAVAGIAVCVGRVTDSLVLQAVIVAYFAIVIAIVVAGWQFSLWQLRRKRRDILERRKLAMAEMLERHGDAADSPNSAD